MTTPATKQSAAAVSLFGPWVEWTEETCRAGRRLIIAVNGRDGQAIHLDPAELGADHPRHAAVMADLDDGGF